MLRFPILILCLLTISLTGCYTEEDASDVNQDRIRANYCTVFNLTKQTTKAQIQFLFGQTPLRMSNDMFYTSKRLGEKDDWLMGLHYARLIDGNTAGAYEWTDENGRIFTHPVTRYDWDLSEPVSTLQKWTYYKLPWSGDQIPNQVGDFTITFESKVENYTLQFSTSELLEISADQLSEFPSGKAIMRISRGYSVPVVQKTEAGAKSRVYVEREYIVTISD